MTPRRRLMLAGMTAVLVLAVAVPGLATEESTEEGATETTVAPEQISEGEGPAVAVPPTEGEEVEHPWTTRYIYPVLVIVTILLIVGVVVGYNRSIRTRYRVVG